MISQGRGEQTKADTTLAVKAGKFPTINSFYHRLYALYTYCRARVLINAVSAPLWPLCNVRIAHPKKTRKQKTDTRYEACPNEGVAAYRGAFELDGQSVEPYR